MNGNLLNINLNNILKCVFHQNENYSNFYNNEVEWTTFNLLKCPNISVNFNTHVVFHIQYEILNIFLGFTGYTFKVDYWNSLWWFYSIRHYITITRCISISVLIAERYLCMCKESTVFVNVAKRVPIWIYTVVINIAIFT